MQSSRDSFLFAISSLDRATAQITNGSFEWDTPFRVNNSFPGDGLSIIPGWILDGHGSSFTIVQIGRATQGANYLELSAATHGELALIADTNFNVPPGYSVSFDYVFSEEGENGGGYASMELGNIYHSFSTTQNWTHVSFEVPSGTTALKFVVGAGAGRNGYAIASFHIDNVQVVPEPCTIALLVFGLGGLPIVLWQRGSDRKNIKR